MTTTASADRSDNTQVERLQEIVGAKGVKAARQLTEQFDRNVLSLAFRTAPKPAGSSGGGFAGKVDRLLAQTDGLSESSQKRIRSMLVNHAS